MVTQKRSVGKVAASVLVGVAIVAAIGAGSLLTTGGDALSGLLGGTASSQAEGTYREVTDSVGRTVQVPDEPQNIACLDSFSGNVLVLIGAGDQLMGVPGGVKSNVLLQEICADLESKEQLGGDNVNIETLAAKGTDVAVVKRSLYDAEGEVAKLDKLGIPYVVVDYETVEEQMAAIGLIGAVCGGEAQSKAGEYVEYYRSTVELVEQRVSQVSDDQKVKVYHSINDPLLTDGTGSLGADWIARTGCIDVSAESESTGGEGDFNATLEEVYAWDPDVIVCNTAAARDAISSDEKWAGMGAVASSNVYNLPVSTSRWGQRGDPETFLGMLWLGKTVYPTLFEDIDLKETVTSYYRDIVGLDIDDETWDAIVAGQGLRAEGSGSNGSNK